MVDEFYLLSASIPGPRHVRLYVNGDAGFCDLHDDTIVLASLAGGPARGLLDLETLYLSQALDPSHVMLPGELANADEPC